MMARSGVGGNFLEEEERNQEREREEEVRFQFYSSIHSCLDLVQFSTEIGTHTYWHAGPTLHS
jgi:hypothetical protein